MIDNEKAVIRRAARGDAAAFEQLVTAYQGAVYRLALRMCSSAAAAEDVAQEAFLSAWKNLPQFRGDSQFSTWLYRLTTHAAIDYLRREKRHEASDIDDVTVADETSSPQETVERSETQTAVRDALAALSPEYREVILLRYMQELSYEEIGIALHLPPGTVKSRLNRAKGQLKEILQQSGNIPASAAVLLSGEEGSL